MFVLLSSVVREMKVLFHFAASDDNKRFICLRGLPREPKGSRACLPVGRLALGH
jgi:hypothetical protein